MYAKLKDIQILLADEDSVIYSCPSSFSDILETIHKEPIEGNPTVVVQVVGEIPQSRILGALIRSGFNCSPDKNEAEWSIVLERLQKYGMKEPELRLRQEGLQFALNIVVA